MERGTTLPTLDYDVRVCIQQKLKGTRPVSFRDITTRSVNIAFLVLGECSMLMLNSSARDRVTWVQRGVKGEEEREIRMN
jgi:hypothetical protein